MSLWVQTIKGHTQLFFCYIFLSEKPMKQATKWKRSSELRKFFQPRGEDDKLTNSTLMWNTITSCFCAEHIHSQTHYSNKLYLTASYSNSPEIWFKNIFAQKHFGDLMACSGNPAYVRAFKHHWQHLLLHTRESCAKVRYFLFYTPFSTLSFSFPCTIRANLNDDLGIVWWEVQRRVRLVFYYRQYL